MLSRGVEAINALSSIAGIRAGAVSRFEIMESLGLMSVRARFWIAGLLVGIALGAALPETLFPERSARSPGSAAFLLIGLLGEAVQSRLGARPILGGGAAYASRGWPCRSREDEGSVPRGEPGCRPAVWIVRAS